MVGNKIKTATGILLLVGLAFASIPNASAIGVWADVSPTGQSGVYDCVYHSGSGQSVVVEEWTVTTYVGTTSQGSPNPPLQTVVVTYYYVDIVPGNACGSEDGITLDDLFDDGDIDDGDDGGGYGLPEAS